MSDSPADRPCRVHLPDGRSYAVAPGETLLAAGLRQKFTLPFSCQSGGCGSCRVRLLEGAVNYPFEPPALSAAEREAGYILMCLAQPQGDVRVQLRQPAQALRPREWPCRVQSRVALAHDVIGLHLKLPRGADFSWLPGQYVDILLDGGRRRSFSIANAPGSDTLELHIRVTPGGQFAHWVAEQMPERAILRFEGPLGAFYIHEDSQRPLLFMAGGTGLAPVKAMLEERLARGDARPMHLYWGVRAARDLYWDAPLRAWAAQHPEFRYTPVLSEPDADWRGARGFVHEVLLAEQPALAHSEVYMSGPPVMVRAGKRAFLDAGLDADHLYYDSFDYAFETWPTAG